MNETSHIVDCSTNPIIPYDKRIIFGPNVEEYRNLNVWVEKHEKHGSKLIKRHGPPLRIVLYPLLAIKSDKYDDNDPGSHLGLIEEIHLNKFCQALDKLQGFTTNANVLDYLLLHPEIIPTGWIMKNIIFPGTIYSYTAEERHYGFYYSKFYWSNISGSFVRGLRYCSSDKKWEWYCKKIDGSGCIRTSIYGDTYIARLI